jgi:hypothetical protein
MGTADALDQLGPRRDEMKLKTLIAAGSMVLTFGPWTSASLAAPPTGIATEQTGGSAQPSGDPSSHGTTDRAGQTPQPIGTGGTAVDQGKGGNGKPANGTSDKKGKRQPKHGKTDKGDTGDGGQGTKQK